jgi:GT2 family glycosyltransferase/peptidoglycan/xylan/chitin deacetylase (PgdA/CDA1 family)
LKISVVIPTYNRRDILARSLSAIFAQDYPADEYELVIVVDGSQDGTLEMLRGLRPACGFRILEQANRGQAAARNAGWRAADGELILFLDDDIVCDRALLREHAETHGHHPSSVVFGLVQVAPESPDTIALDFARANSKDYIQRVLLGKRPSWPNDDMCFANTSLPRSILISSGGFDEQLGYSKEDHDLGLRLWKMGVPFEFQSRAAGYHYYVKSTRELVLTDAARNGRVLVLLSRKHPEYCSVLPRGWTGGEPLWKSLIRVGLARLPVSVEPLLRWPSWLTERFRSVKLFRRWGLRLLRSRISITMLRSAIREAGGWRVFKKEFRTSLPTILYHHVGPKRPGTLRWLTVSPGRFEQHVRWLVRLGYKGIRASDWLDWTRQRKPLPQKPILLTFDDAYSDIAEYALPILKRYGFVATVFVVTGRLGNTNTWDERIGLGTHRLMTAEQIRFWASQGIEFGAHSRTHAELTALADLQLSEEIAGSARDLKDLLQSQVSSFAYPYGVTDDRVSGSVRTAFDQAFTIQGGLNHLGTDPFHFHRTTVATDDEWADLLFRVKLGWSPMDRFRRNARVSSSSHAKNP